MRRDVDHIPAADRREGQALKSERGRRQVMTLILRAGIGTPPQRGAGTLATEPILVLRGPRRSSLKIFDQLGNLIGSARKCRDAYVLSDTDVRCVVHETVTPERSSPGFAFGLVNAGGTPIGFIRRLEPARQVSRGQVSGFVDATPMLGARAIMERPCGAPMGRLASLRGEAPGGIRPLLSEPITVLQRWFDHICSERFCIEDERGSEAAELTYVRPSLIRDHVGYVVEYQPSTPEPMRMMALAACIVLDKHIRVRPINWG